MSDNNPLSSPGPMNAGSSSRNLGRLSGVRASSDSRTSLTAAGMNFIVNNQAAGVAPP